MTLVRAHQDNSKDLDRIIRSRMAHDVTFLMCYAVFLMLIFLKDYPFPAGLEPWSIGQGGSGICPDKAMKLVDASNRKKMVSIRVLTHILTNIGVKEKVELKMQPGGSLAGDNGKKGKIEKFEELCGWCLKSLTSDQALLCGGCQVVIYCDRRHQSRAWALHRPVCGKLGKAGMDRKKDILDKHFSEIEYKTKQE